MRVTCGASRLSSGYASPIATTSAGTSLWKNGFGLPELVAVAHRATDDAAQHVAAAFVRRHDAIDDQKTAGADVIGDDAQRRRIDLRGTRHTGCRADQIAEQIDVVVRMHALHDRGHALQSHARVDRGFRQRRQRAVGRAVVLHEHQVPDLDVAIAVFVGRARRSARHLRAMIKEDLAARPAGAGIAHGPEIGTLAHARHARRITPISRVQISAASSSSRYTVTHRRAGSSLRRLVTKSHARRMASRLK